MISGNQMQNKTTVQPQDYDITTLIPQRPPMIMVDRLVSCDERSATGMIIVRESNIFVHNGRLQEAGIIEFMAQTAAAYTGYKNKTTAKPVAEGYIGAVKNTSIHALPMLNTVIYADITIENEIVGYTIITGKVRTDADVIAMCEIRILTGND